MSVAARGKQHGGVHWNSAWSRDKYFGRGHVFMWMYLTRSRQPSQIHRKVNR